MSEFFHIMTLPFLACLILAGMYAYLGFHVIERQVIFVDLALAQIAILGASFSIILGDHLDGPLSYWLSLGFAICGAGIFSLTRFKTQKVPQEVIIGITYVVSAALLIIVLSRTGEGDEHIKQALVGNILLVTRPEILRIFVVCLAVAVVHYIFRKQFLLISRNPEVAFSQNMNIRLWDFLFYVLFALVVTSSVKIAGVLLIFSFLVVPSACAILFAESLKVRLLFGWLVGFFGGALGITLSYLFDFPTGACVVATFGGVLIVMAVISKAILIR